MMRQWINPARRLAALILAGAAMLTAGAATAGGNPQALTSNGPQVLRPVSIALSEAVSEIAEPAAVTGEQAIQAPPAQASPDAAAPAPSLTFAGIASACGGCAPPNPTGDVGPNHYLQVVDVHFAIWNKSGVVVVQPTPIASLFAPIPHCANGYGDATVLHDQLADRWILTQRTAAAPFLLCIAVSRTPNPAGAYWLYAFNSTNLADSPRFGVWPNGLYAATREFTGGGAFAGAGAYVFDKAAMYTGAPATALKFLVAPGGAAYRIGDGLLPADLDGTNLPPMANAPNPFVGTMDDGGPYAAPADALNLFHLQLISFAPPNATFTFAKQINVAAFDSMFPCAPGPRDCIAQPSTAQKLDILSYRQRPLHRLAYRNFLSHDTLFTNQSVEASPNVAGIRWWELRSPLSPAASLFQQGTVAGADGHHRWNGSVAQDRRGNAALGYSISGPNLFPGIRYVGRLAADPPNTMPWTEQVLFSGAGSQVDGANWGTHSSMNIDPADDCTFWYTNEYYTKTVMAPPWLFPWSTRVSKQRFPNC